MHADNGGIDHLDSGVMGSGKRVASMMRPLIGEFVAHDSSPHVWEFESRASGQTQRPWLARLGCFRGRSGRQPADTPR
jgi:hypothetical protein